MVSVLAVLALLLATMPVLSAGPEVKDPAQGVMVFNHVLTIMVEPIEVKIVEVSYLVVQPGGSVTVVYEVSNRSKKTNWSLRADTTTTPDVVSTWYLGDKPMTPGSLFQVNKGLTTQLKITFSPVAEVGEIPIAVKVYRVSESG